MNYTFDVHPHTCGEYNTRDTVMNNGQKLSEILEELEDHSIPIKIEKTPKKETLEDYMKRLENNMPMSFNHNDLVIMRLDGHCFRTYTKSFLKPFDEGIADAMIFAAANLVNNFNCSSAYVFSDEITCIFPELKPLESLPFNGRMVKICTLASSHCSAKFNSNMSKGVFGNSKQIEFVNKGNAYFDARMTIMPSKKDVSLNILWRNRSCVKNSKMAFARDFFSEKKLRGVNSNDAIKMVEEKYGKKYSDLLGKFRCGVLVKKLEIKEVICDFETGQDTQVIRKIIGYANYDEICNIFNDNPDNKISDFLLKRIIKLNNPLRELFLQVYI